MSLELPVSIMSAMNHPTNGPTQPLLRRRALAATALATSISLTLGAGALGTAARAETDLASQNAADQGSSVAGFEPRSLTGQGNNLANPDLGAVGTDYLRQAPSAYSDGTDSMRSGPQSRYVSNRVFSDLGQNVFSPRGITQWAWTWGQFLDHTFGLRAGGDESSPIAFDAADPLERFRNDLGMIPFVRSQTAPGTGTDVPREQTNTVSSYIDAWSVYGGTADRLDWLRAGSRDGEPTNNDAQLLLNPDGYLPRADARGNVADAPTMELDGQLRSDPDSRAIAGDVRANENIALTSTHTLFAREHNRIVSQLPGNLSEQEKFEIARRVVGATQQYITYQEFLPAMGVRLPDYRGYRSDVDSSISNEFATVGYRAHSQVHGSLAARADANHYTAEQIAAFRAAGLTVIPIGDEVLVVVPLNLAYFAPDLVEDLGLDQVLTGLGQGRQYRNDEMIDDQLRSVLFQIPGEGVTNPADCLDGAELPNCFQGVIDLGAIDIERARDHGIPDYNALRAAYGLPAKSAFTEVTGDATATFPTSSDIDPADPINDPDILSFTALFNSAGELLTPGTPEADRQTVRAIRNSTLAARLKAVYGTVDQIDPFVGMVAEKPRRGSELGELQNAIWVDQFRRLRDGDRFYYRNDPALEQIRADYGIDFRQSLGQVISSNTSVSADQLPGNVFRIENAAQPPNPPTTDPAPRPPAPAPAPPNPAPVPPAPPTLPAPGDDDPTLTRAGKPRVQVRANRRVKITWRQATGTQNIRYVVQVSKPGKKWRSISGEISKNRWSGKVRKYRKANRLRFRIVAIAAGERTVSKVRTVSMR